MDMQQEQGKQVLPWLVVVKPIEIRPYMEGFDLFIRFDEIGFMVPKTKAS